MQTCPTCQRVNPDEAVFCWFDGIRLPHTVTAEPRSLRPLSLDPPPIRAVRPPAVRIEAMTASEVVRFAKGPLAGASSPRELAEKMRSAARESAALLHDGSVTEWFARNSWPFPITGPIAPGLAGVQQFFEAIGVSRPPRVHLSAEAVELSGTVNETLVGEVTLTTADRKWVYAIVHSDVYWLRPNQEVVSGPQRATVGFRVDASLLEVGSVAETRLHLTVNGRVEHRIRVTVEVRRLNEPFTRRLLRPFGIE